MAGRDRVHVAGRRRSRSRMMAAALAATLLASLTGSTVSAATTTELILNDGAGSTALTSVQAKLLVIGAMPTELRLANDPATVDGVLEHGQTRAWTGVSTWSLETAPCPCGDGERTVWAQWRIGTDAWSEPVSDTIALDRTGPTGSVVIDDGATYFGDPWAWKGSAYEYPSVKLTITASDAGPALAPQAWAVSRDGTTWEPHQLDSYGTFDHQYELIRTNVDEGVKKVWVKFQDGLGNWSAPVTDTITLRYDYAGRVVVGDGSGYVDSFVVPVRFAIDVEPPEGIASVWLSSNYLGCSPQPYDADCGAKQFTWSPGMTITWDMRTSAYLGSTQEGPRRVIAWVVSTTGRVARLDQDRFIIDREEPVSGPPRPAFDTGSTLSDTTTASNVSTVIKWTSGSTGSPVDETRLQQRTNSESWVSVTLSTPAATSATRSLSPTASYQFRSKSGDTAGNWSDWTSGATFRVIPIQQSSSSIRYSGTWHTQVRSDASGGSIRYARGKGAKASRTFTGRGVAVVAPRSKTGGEFDVYVDGTRVKTVFLTSETYQARRVVYSKSWTSSATHTITIVKKYANSDYPIFLDAFLVLK